MNDFPAYRLSKEELAILADRQFMPLKQRVCIKMEHLLAELRQQLVDLQQQQFGPLLQQEPWLEQGGKISRGENYHSYAYRVLDLPGIFEGDDLFAFRTVFLWGQPFGLHLILSGRYRQRFAREISDHLSVLGEGFFLADHDTPWVWEFDRQGWYPIDSLEKDNWSQVQLNRTYLKISAFHPLEEYKDLPVVGQRIWSQWLEILFPAQG